MRNPWLTEESQRVRYDDIDEDEDDIDEDDIEFDDIEDNDAAGEPVYEPDGPTIDAFPGGLSKAPFRWRYLGKPFDMEFLGGFVGVAQDPETSTLRPEIG
jgi:hypothetical protein